MVSPSLISRGSMPPKHRFRLVIMIGALIRVHIGHVDDSVIPETLLGWLREYVGQRAPGPEPGFIIQAV